MEAHNYGKKNEKNFELNKIWDAGHGVIVYKCFQNSTSYEAATREAIMIDLFGKEEVLTMVMLNIGQKKSFLIWGLFTFLKFYLT